MSTAAQPAPAPTADEATTETPRAAIDTALAELRAHRERWARLPIRDRRAILRELINDVEGVAERWAESCRVAEGLPAGAPRAGEEWLVGPYFVQRNLQLLDRALEDIESTGQPRIPGSVTTRENGQVVARVFPQTLYDRIFYAGVTAEVWMEPGVTVEGLAATQAVAYREEDPESAICLVLGAGNVSSIGPMDALYKLFVDNQVVVYKMHPVNAYLGPIIADGFQALVDWGVLRIVYGGTEVGAYLCEHPEVAEIHITGSDRTVEAIVFGPGDEGQKRKAERRPRLEKKISSELGNVSPVIVMPGPWREEDFRFHGENLAASLVNNAGFNCNATRVIVTHADWGGREHLLDSLRTCLRQIPTRRAYYPGAEERYGAFTKAHPEAERYGSPDEDELPWTLIAGVDPTAEDEICFRTEAFCGVTAETALEAGTAEEFIERAAAFANERLWGTLNVTLLVHPSSLREPETAAAVERAIAALRYGTVAVNCWAAAGYGLVIPPWGAFPGHDIYDIQSGTGVVHNTLMFSRSQKTVVRAPFRMSPKPVWFPSHSQALKLGRKLTHFEAKPSPWKVPGIIWSALRG